MTTQEEREQYNAAVNLAVASCGDPVAAFNAMPHVAQLLAALQPSVNDEDDANMIIVPSQPSVVTVTNTIQAATALVPIFFPGQGRVTHIVATTAEGDQYRAIVQMSLLVDGSAYPFSTGKGQGFIPLSFLSGFESRRLDWYPFNRIIRPNTQWQIQFQAAITSGTAATYTPVVGFRYVNEQVSGNR